MKIRVNVRGSLEPYEFDVDALVGKVFLVKHPLGEVKFKIGALSEFGAIIQTNQPMCNSDGTRVNMLEASKRFDLNTRETLYVATPTMDYGVIIGLTLI